MILEFFLVSLLDHKSLGRSVPGIWITVRRAQGNHTLIANPHNGKLVAARGTAKENHVANFPSLGFCGRRHLAALPEDCLMLPLRPEKFRVLPSSIVLQTFGAWPCGEGVILNFLVTGKLMPVALGEPQQRDIAVYISA